MDIIAIFDASYTRVLAREVEGRGFFEAFYARFLAASPEEAVRFSAASDQDCALQHLPEGLHARPLASRYGWHVVSIEARGEGRELPYEAVAERVRHTLREQATRRALRHYLLALEAEIGVEGIALDDDSASALMQ